MVLHVKSRSHDVAQAQYTILLWYLIFSLIGISRELKKNSISSHEEQPFENAKNVPFANSKKLNYGSIICVASWKLCHVLVS